MKRILRRKSLGILLIVLVIVWAGVSGLVTWKLTRRPRPPFPEPAPNVSWNSIQSHRLETSDGEQIGAWFVEPEDARACVLLLHGRSQSRAEMLPIMEILACEEIASMSISLRAHGDSSGKTDDAGFSAQHDVLAAVAFLERECPERPLYVAGRSMGAAAALFAARELGDRVDGYFLEAPYKDLDTAVWNRLENRLPPVADRLAYVGLRCWSPLFLPADLSRIAPCDEAKYIPERVPVVLLSGSEDKRCRPAEIQAIYEQVQSHGKLIMFDGATHIDLYSNHSSQYHKTLIDLVSSLGSDVTRSPDPDEIRSAR